MGNGFTGEMVRKARKNSITIGENIRRKRIEQNISQEELAERLDISRQSISKWETGLSEPSTKNLSQLSVIFQCELSELMAEGSQTKAAQEFSVIGVAVNRLDMGKLKCFFQEMPLDILECCRASVVVACGECEDEKKMLKEIVEKYTDHDCKTVPEGEKLEPGQIYMTYNENYPESFGRFFEVLAGIYGENTVAVFFSDFEKSSRKGVQQVKKAGGLCILCEPEEKQRGERYWDASESSLFDYVLEPVNMGYWIANHVRKRYFEKSEKYEGLLSERFYHRVQECLKKTGMHSYADFKEEFLIRSVLERIEESGVSSVDYYGRLLESSFEEQKKLAGCLQRHVWGEKENWSDLLELSGIIDEIKPEFNGIRIWIAGDSSGLDAYVVAMMLADYMENHRWYDKIKIFATDVEEEMVADAIRGFFASGDIEDLPEKWKRRYFQKRDSGYQASQVIRNMIIFSVHDILTNPPFARLDLLICRDVMKKFRIRSRKAMIDRFAYALNQNGYLVLGQGEDIDELRSWFACVEKYKGKIKKKQKNAPISLNMRTSVKESLSVGKVVEELLTASMPACIIVDERHEILYTGKEAGKYLQFKAGEFSKNLFDNVDRKTRVLIDMALKYLEPLGECQEIMVVKEGEEGAGNVNIHVLGRVIRERRYYLIWFEVQEDSKRKSKEYELFSRKEEKLERELDISQANLYQALKELDDTRDKYELINEKLQSTNEELTLMNDELQVVNQELAASNRKLTRVNMEYQRKINEMPDFSREGIDFFELMGLQTVFLDREFCIKKMSEGIPEITHIKEYDIDRNISAVNLMDGYLGWRDDVKAAKEGEKVMRVVDGKQGSRFIVQILPYGFEDRNMFGYVILIQTVERKRSAEG